MRTEFACYSVKAAVRRRIPVETARPVLARIFKAVVPAALENLIRFLDNQGALAVGPPFRA